jgi:hypothetical protein
LVLEYGLSYKIMEELNYSKFNIGYFTIHDRIIITYRIIFNSEFVIFDILYNIIEETYGE